MQQSYYIYLDLVNMVENNDVVSSTISRQRFVHFISVTVNTLNKIVFIVFYINYTFLI